MRENVNLLNG